MAFDPPAAGWAPRIDRLLRELEFDAPGAARAGFARYLAHLTTWGARMDLTAARSADELVDLSLADAVLLAREEIRTGAGGPTSWVDVGSGGGAPGLPLFLLFQAADPKFRGTLVEPRSKRVAFLRSAVGELGLTGVDVVRSRSDALSPQTFSRAVARATLPPPEWLAEGTRLAQEAVWVLVAREQPPRQPGWSIDLDVGYCWPLTGAPRRALRYVPEPVTP
jgi:16S rRNA (guanine527-N7)-methyltransferase